MVSPCLVSSSVEFFWTVPHNVGFGCFFGIRGESEVKCLILKTEANRIDLGGLLRCQHYTWDFCTSLHFSPPVLSPTPLFHLFGGFLTGRRASAPCSHCLCPLGLAQPKKVLHASQNLGQMMSSGLRGANLLCLGWQIVSLLGLLGDCVCEI